MIFTSFTGKHLYTESPWELMQVPRNMTACWMSSLPTFAACEIQTLFQQTWFFPQFISPLPLPQTQQETTVSYSYVLTLCILWYTPSVIQVLEERRRDRKKNPREITFEGNFRTHVYSHNVMWVEGHSRSYTHCPSRTQILTRLYVIWHPYVYKSVYTQHPLALFHHLFFRQGTCECTVDIRNRWPEAKTQIVASCLLSNMNHSAMNTHRWLLGVSPAILLTPT